MEHDFWVGIDWGSEQHQVCLLRGPRFEPEQRTFDHSSAGLQAMAQWLSTQANGQLARVGVAIELPHGPVVEGLLERGFAVYALNPKQLDRFRDRYSVAGAKDDRRDAYVLADALRTDQRHFRGLCSDDALVVQLREVTRCDEELTREQNGLANRLREQLRRYYPPLLAIARDDLVDPLLWALLERYPTPAQGQRARPEAVARLLKENRIRRLNPQEVLAALHTTPLRLSPGTAAAASEHVLLLVPRLRLVTSQRRQCAARLQALLDELANADEEPLPDHPTDIAILRSLPGVGIKVLAGLLAEAAQLLAARELGCTYEQYVLAVRRQDEPEAGRGEAKKADRKRAGKGNNRVWRSPTDPDARVMVHADKHTHLSYRVEAVVDLETGAIVSAGAAPADQSDQDLCLPRVDQAIETLSELGEEPLALVADKGYHCAENLRGIAERGLIPLVTAPRRCTGPEGFTRDDFVYDAASDTFRCPAGEQLVWTGHSNGRRRYRAGRKVCHECEHWGTCTKSKAGRQILVSPDEALVEANRERVYSEAARPLMMIRRQRGERPFGYFKQFGGMARMNGRGLAYAEKKTLLAAVGWNLLLLVKQALREAAEGIEALVCRVAEALSAALRRALTGDERRGAVKPRWRRRWRPSTAWKWALSGGC